MKKDKVVFEIVKKVVKKVSGYNYKVNIHVVVSIVDAMNDLVFYKKIMFKEGDNEYILTLPNNLNLENEKHLKLVKQSCKKIVEYYIENMYCRTGRKTDKNKFKE